MGCGMKVRHVWCLLPHPTPWFPISYLCCSPSKKTKQNRLFSRSSQSQVMLCPCSKPADGTHSVDPAPAPPPSAAQPQVLPPLMQLSDSNSRDCCLRVPAMASLLHCSSPPPFSLGTTACPSGSPSWPPDLGYRPLSSQTHSVLPHTNNDFSF